MTKNSEISRRILNAIAAGKSVRDAVDEILGAGTFSDLASDLYETIRNRA